MTTIYAAMVNSDQTEGRGSMYAVGYYTDLEDAVERIRGQGVMGVGDGEVKEIVADSTGGTHRIVYGRHERWDGQWVDGYVDKDKEPTEEEKIEIELLGRLRKKYAHLNASPF